jgi:hypothetical protein
MQFGNVEWSNETGEVKIIRNTEGKFLYVCLWLKLEKKYSFLSPYGFRPRTAEAMRQSKSPETDFLQHVTLPDSLIIEETGYSPGLPGLAQAMLTMPECYERLNAKLIPFLVPWVHKNTLLEIANDIVATPDDDCEVSRMIFEAIVDLLDANEINMILKDARLTNAQQHVLWARLEDIPKR